MKTILSIGRGVDIELMWKILNCVDKHCTYRGYFDNGKQIVLMPSRSGETFEVVVTEGEEK